VDGQHPTGRIIPKKETLFTLYRRKGGPQGLSGRARKIFPPPRFDSRTFQPIASRYAYYSYIIQACGLMQYPESCLRRLREITKTIIVFRPFSDWHTKRLPSEYKSVTSQLCKYLHNFRYQQNQTSTCCGGKTYNARMNCKRAFIITLSSGYLPCSKPTGKLGDACISRLLEVVESPDNNVELYVNGWVWWLIVWARHTTAGTQAGCRNTHDCVTLPLKQ
jgi:hypothetical protein